MRRFSPIRSAHASFECKRRSGPHCVTRRPDGEEMSPPLLRARMPRHTAVYPSGHTTRIDRVRGNRSAPRRRSFTQSHAGGVVVRSDGGMPRYFLVCARRGPAQWIVPRVTSSRGRRARRRQGAARCGGRRPACAPGPWCPSPTGSRPSVRRTRLYDTERTRFRHRRRRGRGSRVRSKADGPPTASGLSGSGQIAGGGGPKRREEPPRPQSGASRHSGNRRGPAKVRLCCRPQNGARTLDRAQAHRDHRPTHST